MNKLFLLLLIVAVSVSCNNEPGYQITGTLEGAGTGTAVLHKNIDSATIEDGTFRMEGYIEYPQEVTLVVNDNTRRFLVFFLENSRIAITGPADSLEKASVTGSQTHKEYETFNDSMDVVLTKIDEAYSKLAEAEKTEEKENVDLLAKEADDLKKVYITIKKDFIMNNPKSYVTPKVLRSIVGSLNATELESLIAGLDSSLFKVDEVSSIMKRVEAMKNVEVGKKAPEFSLNDVNGTPISLYSKIGGKTKLLLIDFWASWCGPCRLENPDVVKVWKEFGEKGFDVFGVSLDDNGEDWKKAVSDDQLTWTNVLNIRGEELEPAILYAIMFIPSNYLIDENGIIIAHNLRGEDLEAKVREVLEVK